MRTGDLGFWWRELPARAPGRPARAPLSGPAEADVAIVGAGLTGLWTAYYLARAEPAMRIVVLERETVGFGASGRNGGWVSGFFSGGARVYGGSGPSAAARPAWRRGGRVSGKAARGPLLALQLAMLATVDEVAGVLAAERIEADFLKSGAIRVALTAPQRERMRARVRLGRERGLGEEDLRELTAQELAGRLRIDGAVGGAFSPHVARVQPAKLLDGLARAVERRGVRIHEHTAVREIAGHRALTAPGAVSARWVVRATEGYTADLPGLRRSLAPINSSMIVTEPLPAATWEQIGWHGCELLSDEAHAYVYLQRTADGRIAIGGRGVPYRFASASGGRGEIAAATVRQLRGRLEAMFPATAPVTIDHAWSGVLGVARDWGVSVAADPAAGLAWGGGYAGEGLAASNLVGRTLADLIRGRDSELTSLPWVGRRPRRWEPEPLRWLGIRGVYALYREADRRELRSRRPSRLAAVADAVSGRL